MRRGITARQSRTAGWARLAGGLALPVLVLGVAGMRIGLAPQIALQPVLIAGFVLGLAALGLAAHALTDIWSSGAEGAGAAIAGIVYASPALVILGLVGAAAVAYPRLTEVVTDVSDPPAFSAPEAPRGAPSARSIALQLQAYPELEPHVYPLSLGEVYVAVRDVVEVKGWTITRDVRPAIMPLPSDTSSPLIVPEDDELVRVLAAKGVASQSRSGAAAEILAPPPRANAAADVTAPEPELPSDVATIEATAPTPVFGFLDDVVVRIRITSGGTQVDMRSASRIGAHDLGENARRVARFFKELDLRLQPEPGAVSGIASTAR